VSARAWAAFAGVSVLWGIPYLFIKIAVDGGAHPLLVAWGRVTIGAAVLLPIA
jgi:drug/metabolite transporter (DMT)-like permease